MVEKEVSAEFAALLVELMKLTGEEMMYWQARMRSLVESGRVKPSSWAPGDKKQWGNHVKVVDASGKTAGFVDVTDGRKLNPVEGDSAELVAPKKDADAGVVEPVNAVPEQVLEQRTESAQERFERLGDDEGAWVQAWAVDDEFAAYMQDPVFARLVQQENLVMDEGGRWVVGDEAQFLADLRGQSLDRDDAVDFATKAGWVWDGVPGARPALASSGEEVEFEVGRDELVRAGEDAWLVVREPVGEHQLPVGEVVTDEQAKVIAQERLGWGWVDGVDEPAAEGQPVVVSEARVQVPEGTAVLLADRWAWADGSADVKDDGERRVEGAWSAWGETEATRGSTVPVGTVASEGWDVDAEWEREQHYHQFVEQEYGSSADWDR